MNRTVDRYLTVFVMQLLENFKRDDRVGEQEEGIDAPLLPDAPTGAASEADGAGRPVAAAAAAAATSAVASSPQVDGKGTVRMMGVRIQEPVVVDSMASRSGRSQPSTRRGRSPVCYSPCTTLCCELHLESQLSRDILFAPARRPVPYS